jgi:hypothetical protein
MNESKTRLIEAAVRPLSDNAELQAAAGSLLETSVIEGSAGTERAIARWAAVDSSRKIFGWKPMLYVCLAIVSLVMIGDLVRRSLRFDEQISVMDGSSYLDFFHWSSKISEEDVAAELTRDQSLLLFGDLTKKSKSGRRKALWDSAPENPAYFSDYVRAYWSEFERLPPDFLETANRIDPENSWFTYIAAGAMAKDSVKARERSVAANAPKTPTEWDIKNQAALGNALELLKKARSQPEYEPYFLKMARDRSGLLTTRTPEEVTFVLTYQWDNYPSVVINLRHLATAMNAGMWTCGEEEDREAFDDLLADAEAFYRKAAGSEVTGGHEELILMSATNGLIPSASAAAGKLGARDVVERFEPSLKKFLERKAVFEKRKRVRRASLMMMDQYGGRFGQLFNVTFVNNLMDPPVLTMRELEPGRLMDHETLAWEGCHFVCMMMMAGIGLAGLFRFRSPVLIRRLSERFEMLVLPRDWVWIFGAGVIIPLLYFVGITRFSPLGGRGLNVDMGQLNLFYLGHCPTWLLQWCVLAMLVVFVAGALSRRCIEMRCGMRKSWGLRSFFMVVPILSAAACIPVCGWAVVRDSHLIGALAGALGVLAFLSLVVIVCLALSSSHESRIIHCAVARMLQPSCAFAALIVISAAPVFKAKAFYWSGKDTMVRMDENFPTAMPYEYRVAVQHRKEMREMMGDLLK